MSKFDFSDEEIIDMIEEAPACEMATVGFYGQKKGDTQYKTGYRVLVTSDGYPQSHIHIEERSNERKHICVKMTESAYFSHGGWPDIMSVADTRDFDAFLRSKFRDPQVLVLNGVKYRIETYWHYAVYQWKAENIGTKDDLPLDIDKDGFVVFPKQPDYRNLNAIRV
ncbi:MAG: hypothetical protein NC218_01840 [Acetobacter sp.]|nr:hypothetical protein [Acetobacter sp.]